MNITLSADKKLIEKSRAFAKKHNTSLNQLVREYLMRLVSHGELKETASEFERLALDNSGKSPEGYAFDREDIHSRVAERIQSRD